MEDEGVVGQKEDQLGSTPEENCINQEGLRREKQTGERGDPKADRLQSGVGGEPWGIRPSAWPVALHCD